ncbi:MAG TPA: ubiquinone biosynthesis protein UbiE [Cyanobacteria bacterium UBA8530]|nr:ubiquinone biosynthesis protein UbiE [Cyanobacteria bacterium UBA8530]
MKEKITERYSKETESFSLGCANLSPFLAIREGDHLLELGCGSGKQAARLAALVGPKGIIVGLDLTSAMIERARIENVDERLTFVEGDIHRLPFDEDSFDLVSSNCVINHSRDKKLVFAEILRVLRPGGHFLIGDVMAVERLPEEVSSDPTAIADCYGGAIPKEEYLEIIRALGFLRIEQLDSRIYPKAGFLLESVTLRGFKG